MNGIKEGIDLFSNRVKVGFLLKNNLQIVRGSISKSVAWVYDYIMEKIMQKETEQEKEEIKILEQNFCNNLQTVITDCTCVPYGPTPKYINIPILNHITEKSIIEKISKAEPYDIYLLCTLLSERYEKGLSQTAKEEIPFIKKLKTAILGTDLTSPKLSNILITTHLLPKIDYILSQYSI